MKCVYNISVFLVFIHSPICYCWTFSTPLSPIDDNSLAIDDSSCRCNFANDLRLFWFKFLLLLDDKSLFTHDGDSAVSFAVDVFEQARRWPARSPRKLARKMGMRWCLLRMERSDRVHSCTSSSSLSTNSWRRRHIWLHSGQCSL